MQSNKNNRGESQIALKTPLVNFIPYACHFNPQTILTKNGELLQVIKLEGFNDYFDTLQKIDLRNIIRASILNHTKTSDFAFYLHTIRRKKSIDPPSSFNTPLAKEIHKSWVKKNFWDDKYVNDLYITIIYQGINFPLFSVKDFIRSLFFKLEKDFHTKYLVAAFEKIEEVSSNIAKGLSKYGGKKLEIKVDEEGAYSELLTFFSKIIHLNEIRAPLPVNDLSNYLTSHQMAFGTETLEVYGETGKYFANLFSLKEYQETSLTHLDKILQMPLEFVITQTINFIPTQQASQNFEYLNYIYQLNRSDELRKLSGIESFMALDKNSPTNFADSQITIMVISELIDDLNNKSTRVLKEFTKLGFVLVKEDLNLEECFWSQLPANFVHIKRKMIVSKNNLAGFASTHYASAGKIKNKWGSAVTLLRTSLGNPYFFNFHSEHNGNTIVFGQNNTGKTTLINFFLSECLKYNPSITIIESTTKSKAFVKLLGGSYNTASLNSRYFQPDTANIEFLKYFFKIIDNSISDTETEGLIKVFLGMNDNLGSLNQDNINKITALLNSNEFNQLVSALSIEDEKQVKAYCLPNLSFDSIINKIFLFQMLFETAFSSNPNPKILVVEKIETILNDSFYTTIISDLIKKVEENNGIVIFVLTEIRTALQQENFDILKKNIATIIHTPFAIKEQLSRQNFGLSKEVFEELRLQKLITRSFILQQGSESITLELSLNGLDNILEILSSPSTSSVILEKILSEPQDKMSALIKEIFHSSV
jgi:type IV secretion system protein VirB4